MWMSTIVRAVEAMAVFFLVFSYGEEKGHDQGTKRIRGGKERRESSRYDETGVD